MTEPSEEEFKAAEWITDRIVGLYLVAVVALVLLTAAVAAATGIDPRVIGVPIVIGGLLLFFRWASRRTARLPAQRQSVRPIRFRWVAIRLALFITVVLALALLAAL